MSDTRIQKTKQKLQGTLLLLLRDTPFEQVSVTDLCKKSGVSRITFYAYYNDKAELIGEILGGMLQEATFVFNRLQAEGNPREDPHLSCRNLLRAILSLGRENAEFMTQITREENAYLAFSYYWYVMRQAFERSRTYIEALQPAFPVQMTTNFLCTGLWGFIQAGALEGKAEEELDDLSGRLLDILLTSPVFLAGRMPSDGGAI